MHSGTESETPPDPASGFAELPGFALTEEVHAALKRDGISAPTAIQRAVIPAILEGRHVVIGSGTGTGKTLAYLLPLLQRLRDDAEARVVCFAPSAELSIQTLRVAERYKAASIQAAAMVAGGNSQKQRAKLTKSTRLVIGTPGRILELFEERKLKGVNCMVLDESEPVLATREAAYLREILSRPTPRVQLIFAAATFGMRAESWIRELMGPDVVRPQVADDPLRDQISHHTVFVQHEQDRDDRLARLINRIGNERVIVFFTQPNLLRHAYRFLTERGLAPVSVSQERTKQQCQSALQDFARSKARILLTQDSAATGLDIPDVPWVIHYELPNSALAYVHRAGRTGRAGKTGNSLVLTTIADRGPLDRIAKELGLTFEAYPRG